MRRTVMSIAVAAAAILVAGCGAAKKTPPPLVAPPADSCSDPTHQQRLQVLLAARSRTGSDVAYGVSPGDVLIVTVYNYRPEGGDFTSEVRVDERGYLSLPMIEPVQVVGMNVGQVHRALVRGLRQAEVLNEPLISVAVKDYQGQEVVVLGAVARPGMYHLSRGKQTLIDVLSMSGGITAAAGNYVLVRPAHATGLTGEVVAQAYAIHHDAEQDPVVRADTDNLPVCLETESGQPDPVLSMLQVRGGDLIIVPEAGKAFIEGEVEKPGPYQLSRGMTLTQLVASAGGFTFPANTRRLRLIRRAVGGDTAEWEVDLRRPGSATQPDVRLSRDDRIVVPYTLGRKAAYGVYQFVTTIVRITVGGAANIF